MIITPIAEQIFSTNEYWCPKDDKNCIYHFITAIDFGDDAFRLAGAFYDKYGLVYLSEYFNTQPLKEIFAEWVEDAKRSVMNLPYPLAQKVRDFHNYSDVKGCQYFFDTNTNRMISEIDVKAGYHKQQPYEEGKCSLFATTEKGVKLLFSPLNQYELDQHHRTAYERTEMYFATEEKQMACTERPFRVRVQGNDDASWSKNFPTLKEAKQLVKDLTNYGFSVVDEQMIFTN